MSRVPALMTIAEYAAHRGVSDSYVRRLRREGRLEMKGRFVDVSSSDELIADTQMRGSAPTPAGAVPSGIRASDPCTGYTQVRAPAFPDLGVLGDAGRTILTADGKAFITYDPAAQAGMIYAISFQQWHITTPIAFPDFAVLLTRSGYAVPATPEAKRWVEIAMGIGETDSRGT